MLERTTIYVDTSYLLASFYNSWEEGAREQLEVSLSTVVHTLAEVARGQVNQPVHRQFWYDGVPESGPHRYQRTLRVVDGVILRTGQLIEWGSRRSQKAVDTRLVADMVQHAMRGQCTDMVLVSGDADMIPGVEAAVEAGVRVHLVGFGWDSISSALRNSCDTTTVLDPRTDFADSMQIRVLEGPLPPQVRQPRPTMPGEGYSSGGDDPVDMDEVDFRAERAKDDSVAEVREKLAAADKAEAAEAAEKTEQAEDTAADTDAGAGAGAADERANDGAATSTLISTAPPMGAGASATGAPPQTAMPGTPRERSAPDDPSAISRPATDRSATPTRSTAASMSNADPCPGDDGDTADENSGTVVGSVADEGALDGVGPDYRLTERAAQGSVQGPVQGPVQQSPERYGDPDVDVLADGYVEDSTGNGASSPYGREGTRVRVTRTSVTVTSLEESAEDSEPRPTPRPNPSMMAARRKPVRSRYVPLSEEVWSSSGEPTPYDVGQQYATWWFNNAADDEQRGEAHTLTGGALPPDVDRPLLQFACQTLHEFTLNEYQRVALRDGFHEGIRAIIMRH